MLSLCPGGLTFTDILQKVNSDPKIFGKWEQFLETCIFSSKDKLNIQIDNQQNSHYLEGEFEKLDNTQE